MKKITAGIILAAGILCACAVTPKNMADMRNNFTGTFYGVLPCADCPGIETTLHIGTGGNYKLTEKYQDRPAGTYISEGRWILSQDMKKIELAGKKRNEYSFYAFKNQNTLEKLDNEGNKIKSSLNYRLTRI